MHVKEIFIKNPAIVYYDNLIIPKKMETKNIVINEKSYKDLVMYFTRFGSGKTLTMLNLYYHKLMGRIKESEGKKLMVGDYVLDKVLDRIK